jgi:hypothetical protein
MMAGVLPGPRLEASLQRCVLRRDLIAGAWARLLRASLTADQASPRAGRSADAPQEAPEPTHGPDDEA